MLSLPVVERPLHGSGEGAGALPGAGGGSGPARAPTSSVPAGRPWPMLRDGGRAPRVPRDLRGIASNESPSRGGATRRALALPGDRRLNTAGPAGAGGSRPLAASAGGSGSAFPLSRVIFKLKGRGWGGRWGGLEMDAPGGARSLQVIFNPRCCGDRLAVARSPGLLLLQKVPKVVNNPPSPGCFGWSRGSPELLGVPGGIGDPLRPGHRWSGSPPPPPAPPPRCPWPGSSGEGWK